jgi:hypothetical protein
VDEATQATYYRRALQLVFCQTNVTGILLFHSHDEAALASWQSGVYYADGTPKTSLPAVRDALLATRGGSIGRCPGLVLPLAPTVSFNLRARSIRLRCDLDCTYRARLVKLPARGTTSAKSGRLAAETPATVALARNLQKGRYRLTVSLVHPVNPATPLVRESAVLTVR